MRHRAFTIVELLVTIAVIAAMMALVAAALGAAAAEGRATRCRANLRQMAIAAQRYAATYDWYPPAIRYETVNGEFRHLAWDWVTAFPNQARSPGALWSFGDNPGQVQQCPDYHGSSSYGEPHTGYNYNTTYIGGEAPFPQTGWDNFRRGVPPHACRRGSLCAMFGDGGRKVEANKYMRAPLNTEGSLSTVYNGGQAFRHRGATNVAFVDGHIGSANVPCKGKLATPQHLQTMDFPRNGFLSEDDSAYDPR